MHREASGSFDALTRDLEVVGGALDDELDPAVHILAHRFLSWYASLTPARVVQWQQHSVRTRREELTAINNRVKKLLEQNTDPVSRTCLDHMHAANTRLLAWLDPNLFPKLAFRSRSLVASSGDPLIPGHVIAKVGFIASLVTVGTLTFLALFRSEEQQASTMTALQEELDAVERKRQAPVQRERLVGVGLNTLNWLLQHPEFNRFVPITNPQGPGLLSANPTPQQIQDCATEMGLEGAVDSLGVFLEAATRQGHELQLTQHLDHLAQWATLSGLGLADQPEAQARAEEEFALSIRSLLRIPRSAEPADAQLRAHLAQAQAGQRLSLPAQQGLLLWLIQNTDHTGYAPLIDRPTRPETQSAIQTAHETYRAARSSRKTRLHQRAYEEFAAVIQHPTDGSPVYSATNLPSLSYLRTMVSTSTDWTSEAFDAHLTARQDRWRNRERQAYWTAVWTAQAGELPGLGDHADIERRISVYEKIYQPGNIQSTPQRIRDLQRRSRSEAESRELLGWWATHGQVPVRHASIPQPRTLQPRVTQPLSPPRTPPSAPRALPNPDFAGGPSVTAVVVPQSAILPLPPPQAAAGATPMTRSPTEWHESPASRPNPAPQPKILPRSLPVRGPVPPALQAVVDEAGATPLSPYSGASPMGPPILLPHTGSQHKRATNLLVP
jgi:hypothetical protein